MPYLSVTRFAGINTNFDARVISPNSDNEGTAEAVEMDNMDITREGAMVTATGFNLVSDIVGTGGVKNLMNYEKDETNRFLLITHGINHYSISPTDTAWSTTNLGTYGTEANTVGSTVYMGTSATRRAILGNDIVANTTKKADLSSSMVDLGGTPPDGHIMAAFMGRLFIANGVTLFYSAVEDEDDFTSANAGTIRFNDIITGLRVEGQRMIVFTRTFHQGIFFQYDDSFNISPPLKEPYERQYGCLAPKSIQGVGANVYYWSERGIMALGSEMNYDSNSGVPRPQSRSFKIEPSLRLANKAVKEKANSVYIDEKQQYWLSLPYNRSQVPSLTFVYHENWDAWTTRSGFYPSGMALFRNTDFEPELHFVDANSPSLYKFDDEVYSYNGFGYTRRWKSKIFTMGQGRMFKEFRRIDIAGSMDQATEFFVTIRVDNVKKKYRIDNSFLLRDAFSNYIGDDFISEAYLGGAAPSESRFKRFYAPLDISRELREGIELQITIENDGEEQPFKIDFLGIEYEFKDKLQVPRRRFVNTQVPI